MKQFIQDIRVLDVEQLKTVNEYIDTLTFTNTVFDADGNEREDTSAVQAQNRHGGWYLHRYFKRNKCCVIRI